jgi:curved DNA-binding protein CbpA
MDPIFDRLGRLIRSFGIDTSEHPSSSGNSDPFQKEAEDELEEFLRTGRDARRKPSSQGNRTFQQQHRQESGRETPAQPSDPILTHAFAVLGVSSEASWDQINSAHRALLKKHHPDSHAGNEAQVKQATAQSQKINEAYQILKKRFGR